MGREIHNSLSRRSSLSTGELRFGGHDASDAVSTRSMAISITSTQVSMKDGGGVGLGGGGGGAGGENPHSMGIDAVRKLRQDYNINKVSRVESMESIIQSLDAAGHSQRSGISASHHDTKGSQYQRLT